MDSSIAIAAAVGVVLHTDGSALHVLSEVGLALLAVAVGIAAAVGAFTLFHEWLTTTRG